MKSIITVSGIWLAAMGAVIGAAWLMMSLGAPKGIATGAALIVFVSTYFALRQRFRTNIAGRDLNEWQRFIVGVVGFGIIVAVYLLLVDY